MEIGIVGLPGSGKSTLFKALTRGTAPSVPYGSPQGRPNVGVAKVLDHRLDVLEGIFRPKRKVPAEIIFADVPAAAQGPGRVAGISGESMSYLQRADALMVVARAFADPSVPHRAGSIDPFRDVEAVLYELAFADLEVLDRRLTRLAEKFKGAKAPERDALNKERLLLDRLKADLEAGTPVREQRLGQDEAPFLEGFQFLSAKPLLVVVNVGESQAPDVPSLEAQVSAAVAGPRIRTAALCGKLEMELAQLEPAEEQEFRESMGLGESGLSRVTRASFEILDLVTFFTSNANELRAWTVSRGTTALKAAGKIHSDLERGFIRAEVVGFEDLVRCGSIAEARGRGVLRQEGKAYVVKEGDVVNILFNV